MVWQQGTPAEMGAMQREIEGGWAMASINCNVVRSGARASRRPLT